MSARLPASTVNSWLSPALALFLLPACFETSTEVEAQTVVAWTARTTDPVEALEPTLEDKPLEPHRVELLDLAFRSASVMPLEPYIKNRSLAQQDALTAAFELDQPRRGLSYAQQIANWRKGIGLAEYALAAARADKEAEARYYLDLADEEAQRDDIGQAWRRDRIRARIAQVFVVLGKKEQVRAVASDLEDSEAHTLAEYEVAELPDEAFGARMEYAEQTVANGDIDQIRGTLDVYAALFDRFFDDIERRDRIEAQVKATVKKAPLQIAIEGRMKMTEIALKHEDQDKALDLVNQTQALIDSGAWLPQDRIPFMARVAALRFRAGDPDNAQREIQLALARYQQEREQITNIYRADALRPIAEAYYTMGDLDAAMSTYARTVEAGLDNPNGWPRAVDHTKTCCSIAMLGLEPSPELMNRIREVCEQLANDPW